MLEYLVRTYKYVASSNKHHMAVASFQVASCSYRLVSIVRMLDIEGKISTGLLMSDRGVEEYMHRHR